MHSGPKMTVQMLRGLLLGLKKKTSRLSLSNWSQEPPEQAACDMPDGYYTPIKLKVLNRPKLTFRL